MKLYLHILRAHVGPFLFSLFTIMFIFLLRFIMQYIDDLVGKGLSGWTIAELIALNLAWMVVLAVPMSVLVATLMAFGNMSAHNEITAMKASGMSLYRMLAPVVLVSLLLTYLLIEFNNKVLPEANHSAKTLIMDIRRKKPTLTIVAGLFSQEIAGYSILAHKTFEESNDLEGVTIFDYTNPQMNVVVTSERGKVSFTPDFRNVVMDLENGEIHQISNADLHAYRKLRFAKHRIIMAAEGFDFERSGSGTFGRSDRELSAQEMQAYVDSLKSINAGTQAKIITLIEQQMKARYDVPSSGRTEAPGFVRPNALLRATLNARSVSANIDNYLLVMKYNQDEIDRYLVEIYKKYSIPVACIVFVFLGAPLGVMARRGSFGVAATLSLGFFLMYWSCLIGGEKLADRAIMEPWFGMWMANIILGILGFFLTIRIARESSALHLEFFRKFVPKSWRSPEPEPTDQTALS